MRRLGLIAGNGPLPLLFAREARARGISVVAVGHVGESVPELERHVDRISWIHVGELDALIKALRSGGVRQAVMLGGIDKKKALRDPRLDARAWEVLGRLAGRGDDSLLLALAQELEKEGIGVLEYRDFLAPLIMTEGCITPRRPSEQEEKDLREGVRVLEQLGSVDVGQTVVIKERVVLAVEAVEGTNEAILRGGRLGGPGAVVVKGTKVGQDLRFDIPAVGPETIRTLRRAEATALGLEAHRTILLDREGVCRLAGEAGICICGWVREAAGV